MGDQLPVDRGQACEVLVLRQQFRLEGLQTGSQGCPTLPDLLRTDQPERRILGDALGVVHVFIACQATVDRLSQQIRHGQLRVLPS